MKKMVNEKRFIYVNDLIERIKKRLKNEMIIGWLCSIVDEVPTVDAVEVAHGRWLFVNDYQIKCSECFDIIWGDLETEPNYCPNCGADMRDGDGNG